MFCAVKLIQSKEHGLFQKIKSRFFSTSPIPQQINLKSYAPYYYLEITREQCGENFEHLAEIIGRCARFIVPVGDMIIDDNRYVSKYRPTKFPSIMLLNSFKDIIKIKKSPKLSIAIKDEKGEYTDFIKELVKYAAIIKIYTDNHYSYERIFDELYEKFGASIILCHTENINFNCDFTLLLGADECKIVENKEGVCKVLMLNGLELPLEYEKLRPPQTDKLLFASALYELCGVKKLEGMKYNDFYTIELH